MSLYDVNQVIEQAKKRNDELYWKNYGWLKQHQEDPIAGWWFRTQMSKLEADENERYWNDYFRNTGVKRDSARYPIRSGLYSGVTSGESFEATQAIMNLYKKFKW